MERDGFTTSLWQASAGSYSSRRELPQETSFDVLIVGGGITGMATALTLQKAGKSCLVIEARDLGFGTSSGTTAHINTVLETPYHKIAKEFSEEGARKVAQVVQDAFSMIRTNVSGYQIDCDYSMLPGYIFSEDEEQTKELDNIVSYCAKLGVEAEYASEPDFPIPYEKIVLLNDQAQFHPVKYLHGIAKEFEKNGGVIVQQCRMIKLEKEAHFRVVTDQGDVIARQVVYATHTPPGINLLHTLIAPYRSYVVAAELHEGYFPEALAYDLREPYHYFRLQKMRGRNYLVAGGADHKTGTVENTEICYLDLESYLLKYFPIKEFRFRWSSQWFQSSDGLAYIGELPGESENVFVATGFGGDGMIYGHVAALILRDLVLHGHSEYGDIFSPKRVKPLSSFGKFVKENSGVVKELVKDILPVENFDSFSSLAPGEAKIVDYEGNKTGIYKDEAGNLFAIDPICPHMKCLVEWNGTEKSWDCPCHGSRFSYTGELLTGPSSHDLKVYQLGLQPGL